LNPSALFTKKFYRNGSKQDRDTLNEIWYLTKKYNLKPVCVICYKRQPFVSKLEKTFRLTFDTKIQSRNFNFDLHTGGGSNYVIPRNMCVMELKFNSFIPNWAIRIMQKNDCVQQKISKFAIGLRKAKSYSLI